MTHEQKLLNIVIHRKRKSEVNFLGKQTKPFLTTTHVNQIKTTLPLVAGTNRNSDILRHTQSTIETGSGRGLPPSSPGVSSAHHALTMAAV